MAAPTSHVGWNKVKASVSQPCVQCTEVIPRNVTPAQVFGQGYLRARQTRAAPPPEAATFTTNEGLFQDVIVAQEPERTYDDDRARREV